MTYTMTKEMQEIENIKNTYGKACPECKNNNIKEVDDATWFYALGNRYWVYDEGVCENGCRVVIKYCPFCGVLLPQLPLPNRVHSRIV